MTYGTLRCGALGALLLLATACGDSDPPTAPEAAASPAATSTPDPGSPATYTPNFPPISAPARVYVAIDWPYSSYHGSPLASRYVLYADGTFTLQYSSANHPFFEYRGTYREANELVTFEWEGSSIAGAWGASGVLTDETLTVAYNLIMKLSDFEDGVYARER